MEVSRRARGFTIIEIITVIALIAILAAMLFPVFARSRERARAVQCANNLFEIGLALQMYAEDWGGRYPPQEDNLAPIARRMGEVDSLRCPSAMYSGLAKKDLARVAKAKRKEYMNMGRRSDRPPSYGEQWTPVIADGVLLGSDYYYHAGLTNEANGEAVLAAEREASHSNGGHVLYASGRVKLLPEAEWKKAIPAGAQRREGDYAPEQESGGMRSGRGGGMRGGGMGRGGQR
jgi:prepilin-type N-terminal cleavage/methylation domain-containing protein